MRTWFIAPALGAALLACEDGRWSFRDPADATFEYGAEDAPTAGEATAAGQVAASALGLVALAAEAGAPPAPAGAFDGATAPLAAAGALPGGPAFASSAELGPASLAGLAAAVLQRGLAADLGQGCWTATGSQLALDACALPVAGAPGTLTGSRTLSGRFERSPGLARWDAAVDTQLEDATPFRAAGIERLSGAIAWTDTALSGRVRVDVWLDLSSYGQGDPGTGTQGWHEWHTLRRAVTYAAEYQVNYAAASACASRIGGGTITVKRLWSVPPPHASGAAFGDASLRFTWSGCGDLPAHLTVARSAEAPLARAARP